MDEKQVASNLGNILCFMLLLFAIAIERQGNKSYHQGEDDQSWMVIYVADDFNPG